MLDPFGGSGTTLKVAMENNRECTIIEMGRST
ncbi:DNA methyltransferase [Paenibacillus sp. JX-17]|uniref:DNA methyltransferase n=1 Tax=Paenibacillus lacisoli TaxID=3064525 RepID=A0ABT9CGQ7_9BACL|nr:DNA methyltransferase [Paenibacillus sp. JX-17]MDO7908451.1 DNA methyltransferase [Paenibacillus sp. JX-17]